MARTYNQHIILKTLDNQPRILFWDLDEFLTLTVPVMIGIACGSLLVMVTGPFLKAIYSRFKKRSRGGAHLMHKLYWNLPHSAFVRFGVLGRIPPSHKRDLIL